MAIMLELPYPPSINSYWRANGHRRFISKEGRKFRDDVIAYLTDLKVPSLGSAPLEVTIVLRPRDKRKTDIDNRIKAVLDALESFVFDDDCQVERLVVMRSEPVKGGKCLVVIEPHQPKGELAPASRQDVSGAYVFGSSHFTLALKDIQMLQKPIFEAYEAGFINAIEAVHDRLLELDRDNYGNVSMVDVLDVVDSFIKKEPMQ